jgi:DinB superfamily
MGTTSQALAAHFESKLHDAVSLLRTLGDTDWKKVTEAEQWSVGVTAHHYASILEPVGELVSALAAGQAPERFTRATLDEMNAQHARDHAHCTRAETIALLEKSGASTAAVLRGLSDEQLAKRGTVLTDAPPSTVEQLIALVLIKHADQHFGSIRKTIGRLLESA